MFFAIAIATALAISAVVLVLQAILLWVVMWWFGFAPLEGLDEDEGAGLRFRSVLLGCLVNGVLALGIAAAGAVAELVIEDRTLMASGNRMAWLQQALPTVMLIIQVPVAWVCLQKIVGLRWSDAAMATMVLLLSGHGLNIPARLIERSQGTAFRITTDGMAPAVCAVHAELTCPNCGFRYSYNMRDRLLPEGGRSLSGSSAVCPNCGQEAQSPGTENVHYGDRVVLRRTQHPRRGDLVVFEWSPPAPESKPADNKAPLPVSLVERVIGLPGDTVEICAGDVFISGKRLQKGPHESPEMWTVINDTRYEPITPGAQLPRWEPAANGSRWKKTGARWICEESNSPDRLQFTGRLADIASYDGRDASWTPLHDDSAPLVGDVQLQCEIGEFQGSGNLTLQWEFRGQKATATLSPSGSLELVTSESSEPVRSRTAGSLHAGAWLTFAVRDGRAYVMQDDAVLASANVGPQEIELVKSNMVGVKIDPCSLTISASRVIAALSRIVLARDVYYRSMDEMPADPGVVPHGTFNHPCTVPAGFYYLLGDHSQRSLDSRIVGNVPAKEIVGVVWGVFWPLEHWREFR
jgi:type IV secretory pathway protease TraF